MNSAANIGYTEMDSPIGTLVVAATDAGVCHIEFGSMEEHREELEAWSARWVKTRTWIRRDEELADVREQLEAYFRGDRRRFDVRLDLRGTAFQRKVWAALCEIPYGSTVSYKEIGQRIGNAKAVRAVGGANHCNPVPIIVPCHRVIGADGSLVGYGGGLHIKKYLLELEAPHEIRGH